MKVYRKHNCTSQHRTWRTHAKCVWPKAYWVHGEGPFASVAWCRVLTIQLYESAGEAQQAKEIIDKTGCGGVCHRQHELVELRR